MRPKSREYWSQRTTPGDFRSAMLATHALGGGLDLSPGIPDRLALSAFVR
jgi:hypothetical protein